MRATNEHFKTYHQLGPERYTVIEPLLREKVSAGVARALAAEDVRTAAKLSKEEVEFLSKDMPLVKNQHDLNSMQDVLRQKEFGFSPLFDPNLVDACCQRGVFPMALEVKRGVFVFGAKLHVTRGVVRLFDEPVPGIPAFEPGDALYSVHLLKPKKQLAKKTMAYVNRVEDLVPVLQLINLQHGENWLCEPLRWCFAYMLAHPEAFQTKFVIFAVRLAPSVDPTEPLVAAEVGFIVHDVYTSATGAYCYSGCGTLQLAALAAWLQRSGVRIWDLGMLMDYKEKGLGCVGITRKKWTQLIAGRAEHQRSDAKAMICQALATRGPIAVGDLLL